MEKIMIVSGNIFDNSNSQNPFQNSMENLINCFFFMFLCFDQELGYLE